MTGTRARDLGIRIGTMQPGLLNAITDVRGVGVGHRTIIEGDDVRTGVTVVMPRDGDVSTDPVFAAPHRLNGNGEMTGLEWVRESGLLTSPIGLTNTHSVGAVHAALVEHSIRSHPDDAALWALPVVAETWDGRLNDINGFHVRREHVWDAIDAVSRGQVEEGSVGGGTGMVSFNFKSGIGTASRVADEHTVGVLVQSNFGRRDRFTVDGVPVGRFIGPEVVPLPGPAREVETGSIIVVGATDAPLLPHQCARLAQRIALGIGRLGGLGGNSSGDLFLVFSTGNHGTEGLRMVSNDALDELFQAVVESTEEAVLNSMLSAETMTGRGGVTVHALPHDRLLDVLKSGWSPLEP
jgi:D-aminopeptidase